MYTQKFFFGWSLAKRTLFLHEIQIQKILFLGWILYFVNILYYIFYIVYYSIYYY